MFGETAIVVMHCRRRYEISGEIVSLVKRLRYYRLPQLDEIVEGTAIPAMFPCRSRPFEIEKFG